MTDVELIETLMGTGRFRVATREDSGWPPPALTLVTADYDAATWDKQTFVFVNFFGSLTKEGHACLNMSDGGKQILSNTQVPYAKVMSTITTAFLTGEYESNS